MTRLQQETYLNVAISSLDRCLTAVGTSLDFVNFAQLREADINFRTRLGKTVTGEGFDVIQRDDSNLKTCQSHQTGKFCACGIKKNKLLFGG